MLLHVCDIRYACRSCFVLQMSRFTIRFWHPNSNCLSPISGWWFGTLFIFHNIWDNPSHWLSYFSRWLKPPTRYCWCVWRLCIAVPHFRSNTCKMVLTVSKFGLRPGWVWLELGAINYKNGMYKVVPPRYKLVLSPLTIDISPINHSYWSYVHQLSYRTGAPPCIHQKVWLAASAGYKRSWDPEIVDASLVASRICIRGWRGWWLIADIFDIHCGYVV